MSSTVAEKTFGVTPPTKPFRRATSVATAQFELPANMENGWIQIRAQDQRVWFRVVVDVAGTASSQTLDETSVASLTNQVLQDDADGAWTLEPGQEVPYDCSQLKLQSNQAIKILHKSPAATGYILVHLSSGPVS